MEETWEKAFSFYSVIVAAKMFMAQAYLVHLNLNTPLYQTWSQLQRPWYLVPMCCHIRGLTIAGPLHRSKGQVFHLHLKHTTALSALQKLPTLQESFSFSRIQDINSYFPSNSFFSEISVWERCCFQGLFWITKKWLNLCPQRKGGLGWRLEEEIFPFILYILLLNKNKVKFVSQ